MNSIPTLRRNLSLCLISGVLALAQSASAAPNVHPAIRRINPGTGLSRRFLTQREGEEPIVNLMLQGDVSPTELRAQGIEVNTWTAVGMTARCPLSRLSMLQSIPGVRSIRPAGRCRLLLDRSAVDADVATVRIPIPPAFAGQPGDGVLVGLVDSGIDPKHKDFKRPDGSTRIVSVWDQTATGTPPHGFTYGVEWTAAQINSGVRTVTDGFGHGTHVLGVAAGDGRATGHGQPAFRFVGMAPEADLCVVKTDLTTSGIVDAVNYVFQVAASRGEPAVVNLSLGTQEGPHDGTLDLDRMLNALTGPGRIIVAAAGNEGADDIHAQVTLAPSTSQTTTMFVPSYTPSPAAEDDYVITSSWYPAADQVSVTLTTPAGSVLGPVAPGDSLVGQATPSGYVDIYNNSVSARGDHEIYIVVYDPKGSPPPATGSWNFRFTPLALVGSGVVDSYIETSALGDGSTIASWTAGHVFGGVVNAPGDADSVISVGAHVTKQCWVDLNGFTRCFNPAPALGSIARFSSQGPRRDGVQKPELTAPGMTVASSRSANAFFTKDEVTSDGTHVVLSGTSMSTPHVTGAVALLLSHRVHAQDGPSQVRAILESAARADAFTGPVPNSTWGYGKLDIARALGPALNVSITRPGRGHVAVFGTTDSVEVSVTGGVADSVVVSLSKDDGITYSRRIGAIAPVAGGQPELLTYAPDPSLSTYHARIRAVAYSATQGDVIAFSDSIYLIRPELATTFRAAGPNPFRTGTSLYFELLQPARVSLRVYTVRGTLVRTLADRTYSAGRQTLNWDGLDDSGRAASSGIYFCEFRTGSTREARRLVLTR